MRATIFKKKRIKYKYVGEGKRERKIEDIESGQKVGNKMKCAHLFNGIGGFPLAAHWMGWENVMHCEIDPFCNRVMNYHFPNSFQHEDIRTTDFRIWRGRIDLLTGGFPCQDISVVGKGKGITGQKSGLWVEAYRAIEEIRPRLVVLENSAELLKKGFENILYPLSEIGYNAEWECLRAIDFGYPHIRERLFILAYADGVRWESGYEDSGILPEVFNGAILQNKASNLLLSLGRPDRSGNFEDLQLDDGFPRELDKESIRAFGNSIVPEIAHRIFKVIDQYEIK